MPWCGAQLLKASLDGGEIRLKSSPHLPREYPVSGPVGLLTLHIGKQNDRSQPRVRYPCGSCRRPARSRHRGARDADLPDHRLRVRRCRPCRGAVQPAGLRQHLFAHHAIPPTRCWRNASRRWKAAARVLRCASGHAAQVLALHTLMTPGRRIRGGAPALWRLDQPVQPGLREVRLEGGLGRPRRLASFKRAIYDRRPRRSSSKASPIPAASSPTSRRSPKSPMARACR